MKNILLRPAEPEGDFKQLASWLTILEDETNTEEGLKEYYEKHKGRITQKVAQDERGELVGFYWATRDRAIAGRAFFFLYVKPEKRRQGIGAGLFDDLVEAMAAEQIKKLRTSLPDTNSEGRAFAERGGFLEISRSLAMRLDLDSFDDRPYDEIILRLQGEGFQFTSMERLGNTDEAQRKLYQLNETSNMDTPGTDGSPAWASFEDFQHSVCQAEWYRPAGQMVVIDTTSGEWAGMSAITRFDDYAYNLHTGVAKPYRGRKLAQAVKVLALRYAREVLQVSTVRTHHNAKNLPMIAIDQKFGYVRVSGTVLMEKSL